MSKIAQIVLHPPKFYLFDKSEIKDKKEEYKNNTKNAIYKLVSITALKAMDVEPRLKPTAEAMSSDYLNKISFDKKSQVKSATIGCWIQQKVEF